MDTWTGLYIHRLPVNAEGTWIVAVAHAGVLPCSMQHDIP
jgi:hypothetical protein